MKLSDLLLEIRRHNICVWVEGSNLRLSYSNQPDESLSEEIKHSKNELIHWLTSNNIINKQSFIEHFLPASESNDIYRLSFAQERMLFIHNFQQDSAAYHVPFLMEINAGASLDALGEAISLVVNRHPALKSVFR